jgi:hypothetical protein
MPNVVYYRKQKEMKKSFKENKEFLDEITKKERNKNE